MQGPPPGHQLIEPALIIEAQRGSVEAFTTLMDRLRPVVVGMCFAEMGDWDTADDCAQEVFVRLHTRLVSLRDPAKFPAWLRTVIHHVCISEHRRPHRRTWSLDESEEESGPVEDDTVPSVRETLDRKTLRAALTDLVAALPSTQRRVLTLRHFEELSIAEIAELTGLTPASTRTMLCRARVSLRRLIERHRPSLKKMTP